MDRDLCSNFASAFSLLFLLILNAPNAGADERPTYPPSRHENDEGKLTPLSPRAHPYALAAGSGIVNVRFSVRMLGKKDSATTVYLRRSGAQESIAMNDQGVNGDHVAGDNIFGASIPIDTSTLESDSCLSYEAFINSGGTETVSAPLQLCESSFPVRVATPNIDKPVVLDDGVKAVADEVLLYAKPTTSAATIREMAHSINARIVGTILPLNLYQLKLPTAVSAKRLLEIVAQLDTRTDIAGASVNALGQPAGQVDNTTDPEFANQDGVKLVLKHPTLAGTYVWDAGAIGTGVTVVVADYGLDRTHPEFGTPGNCQVINNDCGPAAANDDNSVAGILQWHGTRVAGVIAAKANNAQGIAGVAHGSLIRPYKVTSYALTNMAQIFIDAGSYVISDGASVINASFSGGSWSGVGYTVGINALCAAVNTAVSNGAIAVIAAGNTPETSSGSGVLQNPDGWYYPARCNQHANVTVANRNRIIAVGNSTSVVTPNCGSVGVDQRCAPAIPFDANLPGSNYGAWVDITAPGSDIRTTTQGGLYTSSTGTSFSTPIVSGAVAILKSCGVPLDSIKSTLISSANVNVPYPASGSPTTTPRLDIYRALEQVNHIPTAVPLSSNSLNDGTNTTTGVEVGTLTATDPDVCDKHAYTITGGGDAAKFSIGGAASDRLILTDGVLHYATKPSYTVVVRVTDFFGKTFDQTLTVNVSTVNHAPTISSQTFRINEGSTNGTAVGTVLASDPDSGNVLSYSITAGNTSSAFSINTSTGALSVSNSAALAANPTFSLTVTVTDGGGLSAAATMTVNVNKAPTISNQAFSVNENTANGTSVGAVVASDAGDTLSYSITAGNTSGAFSISSSTGVISVSNSAALVYATNPSFSLAVQVTDSGNLSASAAVTVNVNAPGAPANNAPVIANQTFAIDDGSANGTVVGSVIASDPDAGNTLSYSITGGNTGNAFSINAGTGALSVSNSAAVKYATTPTFSLTVRATDNGGLSTTATVTVNVNAPVTPPPNSGGGPKGGGGCSVMPVGASPDSSLALALLALLTYRLRRRIG